MNDTEKHPKRFIQNIPAVFFLLVFFLNVNTIRLPNVKQSMLVQRQNIDVCRSASAPFPPSLIRFDAVRSSQRHIAIFNQMQCLYYSTHSSTHSPHIFAINRRHISSSINSVMRIVQLFVCTKAIQFTLHHTIIRNWWSHSLLHFGFGQWHTHN